jgi:hypothetical protein
VSDDVAAPRPDRDGIQRLLNGLALLLIAGGVALYLFALWRMESIAGGTDSISVTPGQLQVNLDRWYTLQTLSRVGLGLGVAGVVAALAATLRQSLRIRRRNE